MKRNFIYLLLALAFTACKKGEQLPNQAPETSISVGEINLVGEDRLRSEVTLHWLGYDKDGYVTGYELSMDGNLWEATTTTDSTFQFSLELGQDTTDVDFWVRAIDNDGDTDPSPAYLLIPIRNSAPTAVFDSVNVIPDTNYIVTTIFVDVDDLDGVENIDSIYIQVNNGGWYPIEGSTQTITLVPDDPTLSGAVSAEVYEGASSNPLSQSINGLLIGQDNRVYLKARDIAGSESAVDTSKSFFVKGQTSDLLVIDAHAGGSSPSPEEVILPAIDASYGGGFDYIDMRINGQINKPTLWTPTFSKFISFYDKIVWYSDESEEGLSVLEEAAGAVLTFLNANGKLMVSTGLPGTYDNTSVIQEFMPMDSISTSPGLARLPTGNKVSPAQNEATNYDTLECSVFMGRTSPFYIKATADTIFTADFLITGGWVGPNVVAAKSTNQFNNTNVILLSLELHKLNGDPAVVESFLSQVLNQEFNW